MNEQYETKKEDQTAIDISTHAIDQSALDISKVPFSVIFLLTYYFQSQLDIEKKSLKSDKINALTGLKSSQATSQNKSNNPPQPILENMREAYENNSML